jgi:hypothetical protein
MSWVHHGHGLNWQRSLGPPCTEQWLKHGAHRSKHTRSLRGATSHRHMQERERRQRRTSPTSSTVGAEAESSHRWWTKAVASNAHGHEVWGVEERSWSGEWVRWGTGGALSPIYRARGGWLAAAQPAPLMAAIFGPKGKWRGGKMGSWGGRRLAAFHGSGGGAGGGPTVHGGCSVIKTGGGGCCREVEENGERARLGWKAKTTGPAVGKE